ncbi:MAG TPA: hypothetical protein VFT27_01745 [Actinomycetota bacterium]|nr:hypothetical protein [Actinomycetota bacterium]
MLRIGVGLFLIAHGLVHLMYLAPPQDAAHNPFVAESRWFPKALGMDPKTARAVAGTLAVATATLFLISGITLFASISIWKSMAVTGSLVSLVLMLLFLHPWLMFGLMIDVAIIAGVLSLNVPSSLLRD